MNTIVFTRIWNPAHIKTALMNARLHAPECRVVHLHCGQSSVGWDDSENVGAMFNATMAHLAAADELWGFGDKNFQKACIARWMVISAWMASQELEEVCACDSDVLIFDDPFKSPHYAPGRLLLSSNHTTAVHAGHAIVNTDALDAFWIRTAKLIKERTAKHGTVNDLAIWSGLGLPYTDQNQIIDGVTFDHHMGHDDGQWKMHDGYKVLSWGVGGKPYALHLPTGNKVRLLNLHCWNKAENHMEDLARQGGLRI